MFSSIWSDVKREFQIGNMITRLIIVNVAVFLVVNIVLLGFYIFHRGDTPPLFEQLLHLFCIGKAWQHNVYHPWVWLTNMFLHQSFFHMAWNMLYLYWFGQIVGDLIGNHRVLPIYILGGLAGALVYFISANYFLNIGDFALGASAAVMAIIVAAGVIAPDYILRLLFLGDVKLKYIVLVLLILDLVGVASTTNSGGHLAHLGGAVMGYVFAARLRAGQDLSAPINRVIDWFTDIKQNVNAIFSPKPKPRPKPEMAYRRNDNEQQAAAANRTQSINATEMENQVRVDSILDKIKASGYDSLSQDDKDFLFKMSK
jgi:membrane associated rhomboid family serine protease